MSLHSEVLKQVHSTAPKSTKEKHEVAKRLVEKLDEVQIKQALHSWTIGAILYEIRKYGLHHYAYGKIHSMSAFYDEIGIPQSTARYRIALWEFYIEKHGYKIDDLLYCDMNKLQRAISYIREQDKKVVNNVVELAQRGRMSRDEFIDEVKQYGIQQ